MSLKREDRVFKDICSLAYVRVVAVLQCIDVLLPGIDARRKKRIARKILSICDGKDRSLKITDTQLEEIVLQNSQCISKSCPLLLFWEPMSRQLNAFFNEEDR